MKKFIFSTLIFISLFSISLWASIDLNQTIEFDNNAWDVFIPSIVVNLSWENLDEFSIFLWFPKLIFLDTYSWDLDYYISDNHKKLTFKWDFENETITIEWLKIRVYDQKINEARIYLDTNNDSIADSTSTKYIQINDEDNNDETKPLAIKNLSYEINGKNINLSWMESPDLDTTKQIVRIHRNGYFMMDKFLTAGDTSIVLENFDTSSDKYKIEIYARDYYYSGEPVSIEILPTKQDTQIQIEETKKYSPKSDSYVITTIATYIDTLVDNKYDQISIEKNKVIDYRNELIIVLEDFITKTISKTQAQTKFMVSLGKLMPLIK